MFSFLSLAAAGVKTAGHSLVNGLDDVIWIVFWLQIEACAAVIANSFTAFRSLFTHRSSQAKPDPPPYERHSTTLQRQKDSAQKGTLTRQYGSWLAKDPFEDTDDWGADTAGISSPRLSSDVMVMHDVATSRVRSTQLARSLRTALRRNISAR